MIAGEGCGATRLRVPQFVSGGGVALWHMDRFYAQALGRCSEVVHSVSVAGVLIVRGPRQSGLVVLGSLFCFSL